MQFELMQIHFPEQNSGSGSDEQINPSFSTLRSFKTLGIVMNVFLLDPEARLLAGFVWIGRSISIGLYVLLDWDKEEYVFIDTGIECVSRSRSPCAMCHASRPRTLTTSLVTEQYGKLVMYPMRWLHCDSLGRGDLCAPALFPAFCPRATCHVLQFFSLICTTDDHASGAYPSDLSGLYLPSLTP